MTSGGRFLKSEHLVKTKDFRRAYKEGVSFKKDWLVLYALTNGREANRVGFAVSARAIKLAVRRNRIKRLLREAYRANKNSLKRGYDIVMSVKRDPLLYAKFRNVSCVLMDIAKKAGLLA